MFCPHCGQKQISNEVSFCSNCGFHLNVVSDLMLTGGRPAYRQPPPNVPRQLSPRQKGIRQGAMLMLSSLVIIPLVLFIGVVMLGADGVLIPLAGSLCIMGGLLRMLYAVFFESDFQPELPSAASAYVPPPMPPNYLGTPLPQHNTALPPPQANPLPAQSFRPPRYDTGELPPPPPSVTDHTTQLLGKKLQDETPQE
ncbi:MAG TPA: hypothetical protein VFS10_01125 [Pyrinomonadaceae bacterium]|nr:hypothetical protein [Pyrinomonadaceae bacterium]